MINPGIIGSVAINNYAALHLADSDYRISNDDFQKRWEGQLFFFAFTPNVLTHPQCAEISVNLYKVLQ